MHFWDKSAFAAKGLDELDCKILYELDCNCRQSNAAIGKKLRVNKNVVNYRIGKLLENGFIDRFYAVVDSPKLGFQTFRVYLKFSILDEAKRQEVFDFISGHKHVWWSGNIDGEFDFGFLVWVKNTYEFRDFWIKFLSMFQEHIQNTVVCVYNGLTTFACACILPHEVRDRPFQAMGQAFSNVELSNSDKKVLAFVSSNAREPIVSIAQRISLSPVVVRYSLKKMEASGIILAYRAQLNSSKLGYLMYKLHLRLKNRSKYASLLEYARICPHIVFWNDAIGYYDFEVEMLVQSYDEFKAIQREVLTVAGDTLADYSHFIYYKLYDIKYYPE
ncbi:MAG: Lrp/AsnC family transcriptional regulator [Candidatus Diapherotrites archaeon]|uniref:Lrp/AsnC family transcriptional regulator n=1 Tax=Candidatus Iainarchaeum sp. TaxID=3101447 RepID=A0A8T4L8Y8_9ARCH|nr:Lrp/AsnC family transcriptional regulator [Candidatus Diapherotrites archaeon]